MVFLPIKYMAWYLETYAVIIKVFPKTMQFQIIKNFMEPYTNRKKIPKVYEKKLLLLKQDGIFEHKIHGQVLNDFFCNS